MSSLWRAAKRVADRLDKTAGFSAPPGTEPFHALAALDDAAWPFKRRPMTTEEAWDKLATMLVEHGLKSGSIVIDRETGIMHLRHETLTECLQREAKQEAQKHALEIRDDFHQVRRRSTDDARSFIDRQHH